jgi:hypothetical protein
MITLQKIPTLEIAIQLLNDAERRNPGQWVSHSVFVAKAAEIISTRHPTLDPVTAHILGLLHDIGRREGVTDQRHIIDGYCYLISLGFDDAAQICLTHSFPVKDINAGSGEWDCSVDELEFVTDLLSKVEYTEYDKLLQLCDAVALPTGFCLIEKRLVDVALRRGVNKYSVEKWKTFLDLQKEFEQTIGQSIYSLLPQVIENTFGFHPNSNK